MKSEVSMNYFLDQDLWVDFEDVRDVLRSKVRCFARDCCHELLARSSVGIDTSSMQVGKLGGYIADGY